MRKNAVFTRVQFSADCGFGVTGAVEWVSGEVRDCLYGSAFFCWMVDRVFLEH